MKQINKIFFLLFISSFFIISCTDNDDNLNASPVHNFIWKGLNYYYLYQSQVPDLDDNKFGSQVELDNYLNGFSSPEALFNSLIYDRQNVDKYSVLFSNYIELEQLLQGVSESNGLEYGLSYRNGSTTELYGWIKYVLPNSDAATKNLQRGNLFTGVNGTNLTINNYRALLDLNTYTLNLATSNAGVVTPNGQTVSLTKAVYSENPVLLKNVHQVGNRKMGYLVYNGFYTNYETDLNNAFGYFKSENVTDLILDLRYNSGGSIATAVRLGSMITGQFNGQLFAKQQWNSKLQASINPSDLNDNYVTTIANGTAINSLNLAKIYIITSKSTASASELIINCLKPYITVIQVGTTTTGKNVGSVTLYDSPNFRRQGANPNHTYAMQPIVLKVLNKDGFGDYANGIAPLANNTLEENKENLGQLGEATEPLLAKVLEIITNGGRSQQTQQIIDKEFMFTKGRNLENEMFIEQYPLLK